MPGLKWITFTHLIHLLSCFQARDWVHVRVYTAQMTTISCFQLFRLSFQFQFSIPAFLFIRFHLPLWNSWQAEHHNSATRSWSRWSLSRFGQVSVWWSQSKFLCHFSNVETNTCRFAFFVEHASLVSLVLELLCLYDQPTSRFLPAILSVNYGTWLVTWLACPDFVRWPTVIFVSVHAIIFVSEITRVHNYVNSCNFWYVLNLYDIIHCQQDFNNFYDTIIIND